eukprot:jgi/Tetstr1/457116/TSEL_043766.t1
MSRRIAAAPNLRNLFELASEVGNDGGEATSLPVLASRSGSSGSMGTDEASRRGEGSRRGGTGPLEQMWFGLWLVVGVAFLWLVFVVQQIQAANAKADKERF